MGEETQNRKHAREAEGEGAAEPAPKLPRTDAETATDDAPAAAEPNAADEMEQPAPDLAIGAEIEVLWSLENQDKWWPAKVISVATAGEGAEARSLYTLRYAAVEGFEEEEEMTAAMLTRRGLLHVEGAEGYQASPDGPSLSDVQAWRLKGETWVPPEADGESDDDDAAHPLAGNHEVGPELAGELADTFRGILASLLPQVAASRRATKDEELMVVDHLNGCLEKLKTWLGGEFERMRQTGRTTLKEEELLPMLGRFLAEVRPHELAGDQERFHI
ncbi:unnamed protein product [Pedinophyceae sp. YPF-701]|nr:unnamed protein product [Pedinophyceae sp. YPF-701]